jgi:hypothetical protein
VGGGDLQATVDFERIGNIFDVVLTYFVAIQI